MLDEKVLIERLEERKDWMEVYPCSGAKCPDEIEIVELEKAKAIINQLAEEHNNGWIACSERLPKISNSYLVTKMHENNGTPMYETSHEIFWISDEKWDCERDEDCEWKVIAWQNKLAPYQPKGE